MSVQFHRYLALAVLTTGLLTSCTGQKREPAATVDSAGDVPPPLLGIDEKAEQIVGFVSTKDWPQIYAHLHDINDVWMNYTRAAVGSAPQSRPLSPAAAAMEKRITAALSALKDAVAKQDESATMRTASDLSAAAADLYGYYHAAIPADLRRLEVLERQMLIDLSSDTFESALRTLESAEETWRRVQPTILARAGFGTAQALGGELKVQRTAIEVRDRNVAVTSIENMLSVIRDVQRLY